MAKVTRSNGPSYTEEELADPRPARVIIRRAELGGVTSSVGNNLGVSTEKPPNGESSVTQNPLSPAQTTENHSSQPTTDEATDADSTVGHGRTTGRASSRRTARKSSKPEEVSDDFNF